MTYNQAACGTCFYYTGDAIDGTCRRYPPTVKETSPAYYSFTRVPDYYWCGEYKPLKVNIINHS